MREILFAARIPAIAAVAWLALFGWPTEVVAELGQVPDAIRFGNGANDPDGLLRVVTPPDALRWREKVRSILWGGDPPSVNRVTTSVFEHDAGSIIGRAPRSSEWLHYRGDGVAPSRAIYVQTKQPASDCLFLYHAGHRDGFIVRPHDPYTNTRFYFPIGARKLVQRVAAAGCDLLLFSMPLDGENRYLSNFAGLTHDGLGKMKPANGSALRYFVDPVLVILSHTRAMRGYTRIAMAGLSGGGWTTTMVAAIEPNVGYAYSVAGSLPNYLRQGKDLGDWEQTGASELWSTIDYLDLYLMGVAEPSRRATHFWLRHDTCCFKADVAIEFAAPLRRHAQKKGFGPLQFLVDTTYVGHDVTEAITDRILADITNGMSP